MHNRPANGRSPQPHICVRRGLLFSTGSFPEGQRVQAASLQTKSAGVSGPLKLPGMPWHIQPRANGPALLSSSENVLCMEINK